MALAIQEGSDTVGECIRKPPSSKRWVSDNGATNHFTSDSSNVYDWIEIPPGKERVLIGDGKAIKVTVVGSLNLKIHSKTDFNVTLTGVYVTEGAGFNLFSLHQAQARQTITMDNDGVHLLNRIGGGGAPATAAAADPVAGTAAPATATATAAEPLAGIITPVTATAAPVTAATAAAGAAVHFRPYPFEDGLVLRHAGRSPVSHAGGASLVASERRSRPPP